MSGIEKIGINFSLSSAFFFIGLIVILLYAAYSYRYTIPVISRWKKILLISLRSLALILLLFVFFEPVLSIIKKESFHPVNLIFFDNSRSIRIKDGTDREKNAADFLNAVRQDEKSGNAALFKFGSRIDRKPADSLNLNFNEGNTNLSEIFSTIEKSPENISSITIVSDGVITEGSNPVYKAAEMNIPVYTLGLGDSSVKNDLLIRDVLFNEYIYSGISTSISAEIVNRGYANQRVLVSFIENGKTLDQQNIILSGTGLQDVKFDYKSGQPGEKKLTLTVSELQGEQSTDNNKKVFFVNVLNSKIKVLLLAGAPSNDLSFIRNSLLQNQNISVSTLTQIAPGKFLENTNRDKTIDSADIFFLIGFPSKTTDNQLFDRIVNKISVQRKPFIVFLGAGMDFSRMKRLQQDLPFNFNNVSQGFTEVLPDVDQGKSRNPLMQTGSEKAANDWGSLPPVNMFNADFTAKPESEVLSTIKIRNVPIKKPLIITRKIGSRKSAAILAQDIWRWKLETAQKGLNVFDSFLQNSVRWLNTKDDQKQVVIKTSKKLYAQGEQVQFTGQVYDQSYNPIPDAKVTVNIRSGDETNSLTLDPLGNGLYSGNFETNKTGDFNFTGNAVQDKDKIGSDNGSFNIGEVDIEMLNPRMDYAFLSLLSSETRGKFFSPAQMSELVKTLRQRIQRTSDTKIVTSEFTLWSNEWLMAIVILLFAFEWFIRKQSGML